MKKDIITACNPYFSCAAESGGQQHLHDRLGLQVGRFLGEHPALATGLAYGILQASDFSTLIVYV
jgi:hypothetical protein